MVLLPLLNRIGKNRLLWIFVMLGAIAGALPDLIGAFGILVLKDHWVLYSSAHESAIAHVLQYVPMYGLHLFIDSITHGRGHRWWILNEGFWLEVVFWVVNALLIAWSLHRLTSGRETRQQEEPALSVARNRERVGA